MGSFFVCVGVTRVGVRFGVTCESCGVGVLSCE